MKNSFLSGAIVLMIANIISKVLGAVLKIPLTYIIHEEGMAVYNTAFSVYVMFLSFVVAGTPFAVQKLTAAAHARKDHGRARETVFISTVMLAVIGLIGSAVLWLGADFFALAMKEEQAGRAIRAIAPSIFLVACGTAVKSGFQGRSDMVPTAVSQVIESFIKLGAGYALAVALLYLGTEYAAAGAAAGVTIGEAAATLMLVVWYLLSVRKIRRTVGNRREILKELTDIALPMLFMSVAGSVISACDTSVIRASLLRAGLSAEKARFVYGAYTGYAMTVLNLPSGFLATLGVSVIPIISGAAAVGNAERIRSVTRRAIGFAAAAGTASVIGLCVFGELILHILFHNTYSAPMLRMAAPSVLFICVMQISGSILQSMGCIWRAFAASITAAVIKLAFSAFLASRPEFNIYGTIIGTDLAFFVGMLINLFSLSRKKTAV
ncbi:MAG: oligosaccharide flippase family protein [Candidatus Ornithomonoglobus sp.]